MWELIKTIVRIIALIFVLIAIVQVATFYVAIDRSIGW